MGPVPSQQRWAVISHSDVFCSHCTDSPLLLTPSAQWAQFLFGSPAIERKNPDFVGSNAVGKWSCASNTKQRQNVKGAVLIECRVFSRSAFFSGLESVHAGRSFFTAWTIIEIVDEKNKIPAIIKEITAGLTLSHFLNDQDRLGLDLILAWTLNH